MDPKWRVMIAVGFGTYMATMDFNIVAVALPTLADEFNRSPDTVVWATLASNLVVTGLTLTAGRAGDLFGRKRLYVLGWVIFTVGMFLAGAAQSIEQLIAFRFFQATGVALAIANGNAIVTDAFPAKERGRALGTVGAIVGAGLMSGPIVGGLILSGFSWHWIFYFRVPIGLIAIAAAFLFIQEPRKERTGEQLDIPGAVTLFFALGGSMLAVNRGGSWGWSSPAIIGLFVLGAAGLAAFIWVEARSKSPVVALPLFKLRAFSASVVALLLTFLGQAAAIFMMPFYLIDVRGYSTAEMGLIVSTIPIVMLFLSSASGYASDRWNFRYQTTIGTVLVMLGLLSLGTLQADTPVALVIARLAIIGLGISIFMAPNSSAIMGSVPRTMLGTASAATATARNIGNATGLAISAAVLVGVATATSGIAGVSPEDLPPDALLDGLRAAFIVAGLMSIMAVIATLFLGPPHTEEAYDVREPAAPAAELAAEKLIAGGSNGDAAPAQGLKSQRDR